MVLLYQLIQVDIKLKLNLLSTFIASRYINVGLYLELKLNHREKLGSSKVCVSWHLFSFNSLINKGVVLLLLSIFYIWFESYNHHLPSEYSVPGLISHLQNYLCKERRIIHVKQNYFIFCPNQSVSRLLHLAITITYSCKCQNISTVSLVVNPFLVLTWDTICLYLEENLSFNLLFSYLPFFNITLIDLINSLR